MFMLRWILIPLLFVTNILAIEVAVTTSRINYNETISLNKIKKTEVSSVEKFCTPLLVEDFAKVKYIAKHYMRKGFVICESDVKEYKKNSVLIKFGSIEIETDGKLIFENDEYIKIKRNDGKIEKIYKDGKIR